jgi:hypothetical protein
MLSEQASRDPVACFVSLSFGRNASAVSPDVD